MEPLNPKIYKAIEQLSDEEFDRIFSIVCEFYNAIGEIDVKRYIERTEHLDELMIDGVNPGLVHTKVLTNPDRIWIFIEEYPPRLKQYIKTKFSKELSYGRVRKRWQMLMLVAGKELRNKNCPQFNGECVAIYNFHFPKAPMDADNMTVKFLNDSLRNGRLIVDDDFKHLSTYLMGTLDDIKRGVEITLISKNDFMKNCSDIL